jgi:hypothetical protein
LRYPFAQIMRFTCLKLSIEQMKYTTWSRHCKNKRKKDPLNRTLMPWLLPRR